MMGLVGRSSSPSVESLIVERELHFALRRWLFPRAARVRLTVLGFQVPQGGMAWFDPAPMFASLLRHGAEPTAADRVGGISGIPEAGPVEQLRVIGETDGDRGGPR
jgi:hypothetical protein